MAFTFTITCRDLFGGKRVVYGTFANTSSSTGGDISLKELHNIDFFYAVNTASSVGNAPSVNGSVPLGNVVTLVTDANMAGIWMALGV